VFTAIHSPLNEAFAAIHGTLNEAFAAIHSTLGWELEGSSSTGQAP
jgi:hypothetical protein